MGVSAFDYGAMLSSNLTAGFARAQSSSAHLLAYTNTTWPTDISWPEISLPYNYPCGSIGTWPVSASPPAKAIPEEFQWLKQRCKEFMWEAGA